MFHRTSRLLQGLQVELLRLVKTALPVQFFSLFQRSAGRGKLWGGRLYADLFTEPHEWCGIELNRGNAGVFSLQVDRVCHLFKVAAHALLLLFKHRKLFGEKWSKNVTLARCLADFTRIFVQPALDRLDPAL